MRGIKSKLDSIRQLLNAIQIALSLVLPHKLYATAYSQLHNQRVLTIKVSK